MIRSSKILSLMSCLLLSSSSSFFERCSDSRRLLIKDQNTGRYILYEFEDLDHDGDVEVCVSGDPERKIKVYAYFSKKHADHIQKLTGVSVESFTGYSFRDSNSFSIKAENIIMDEKDQERANYLFTLAEKLYR